LEIAVLFLFFRRALRDLLVFVIKKGDIK